MSDKVVVVGKVGKTYGVKGWLKIHSFTDPASNILNYKDWLITLDHQWQTINLEAVKQHGTAIIAKFTDCDTPEIARRYTNHEIAIYRSEFPELEAEEYYWADLIGLTVIDETGTELGIVTDIMATGSNDILIVKGKKHHFIPYIQKDFICKIDLANKQIHVHNIETLS